MRQNDIKELSKLNSENLENLFNVYQEENGLYYYNIIQSIEFPQDLPKALFTSYVITYGDTWPFISYKVYESPNLWWLILLANNIDNPLILPEPGKELNIPVVEVVREVLAEIKKR